MRNSDIRGALKLTVRATTGVTRIVEGVHQSVWDRLGFPGGQRQGTTRGVTGAVYRLIHGITDASGKSADALLAIMQAKFSSADPELSRTPGRERFISILNGVMGDHLVRDKNPFAISMSLRYEGSDLDYDSTHILDDASGKIVLLIHGLCSNDLQVYARNKGLATDTGEYLAASLGYSPVYLRYNTGLHISQNGQALSNLLEKLIEHWPHPINDLSVIGHSMGGLVLRSALHHAESQNLNWPAKLENLVFLGTPHHGSPLETAGTWLDTLLGKATHTQPFTALGKVRSAGITDLRHGNLRHEDWHGHDRFHRKPDSRQPVPLPQSVKCFTIAATLSESRGVLADHLVGDGLVPLRSALGQHNNPSRNLAFAPSHQRIVYRTGHLALLDSPEVNEQIVQWLTSGSGTEVSIDR
jgi:pimeloyl-ACP methyl ester carboxylesterase